MQRLAVLSTLIAALAACAGETPRDGELSMPLPMDYEEHSLDNGLTVITLEDHSTPIVHLELWYHVGSKDELEGGTGFAHLFEHLMFQGSANVRPEEHSSIISRAGGFANAYTTDDVTVFLQTAPANYLETILWLEADRMRSLDVSEENFLSEREVVKEERRVRYESPPYGDIFETLFENAFDVHPYRHTPIGSMEDLDNATVDDVRDFWATYYVPSNAYLVIVGDFNTDDILQQVERYFGNIPAGSGPPPRVTLREPERDQERRVDVEKAVPLPAYLAGYFIPEDGHPDAYPLIVASMILAEGRSSRIYQSLVYDSQLALEANSGAGIREHPHLFYAILIMNQGARIEDGEAAMEAEFRRMMDEPVTDEELEKARNQLRSSHILGRQSITDKASALGHAAVIHGDTSTADGELQLMLEVTKEDIMRVIRQYLQPENRTVVTLRPPGVAP